ncbi:MAG: hypothetical protein WD401_05605 [Thermomicrobiaceae bacterium]
MRQGWLWVIVGGVAILLIGLVVGLYFLGGDHQSALERLRDISLVFISIGVVLFIMLMAGLVGAVLWLVLLLKDKVIPLLEEVTATASRARGTTNFVSEEVAKPIISTYSSVAGLRAMIKTVTKGVNPKKGAKGPNNPDPTEEV